MKNAALLLFMCIIKIGFAQEPNWKLKFVSTAEKDGKSISGVSIALMQGTTKVAETSSGGNGNFELAIPPNGDYMVVVSYEGCNTKRFQVSTRGVPTNLNKDNFDAVIKVIGVIMAKPMYSIDYSLLQQPMLQIIYDPIKKKFTDDPVRTNQMLASLQKIRNEEAALLEKFNDAIKAGDIALKKRECDMAKQHYEKAIALLPDEDYPKKQLELVNGCIKENEELASKNKNAEAEKLKAAEAKAIADKLKSEQLANELKAKQDADKITQEKLAQEKLANDKLKAEQLETDRINKAIMAQEKLASDKSKAEQLANDLKAKQEVDKISKAKIEQDKSANDKLKVQQKADELKAKQAKAVSTKTIEPKPVEEKIVAKEPTQQTTDEPIKKTEAKYSAPLGFNADVYKQTMLKATDLIKMKRYAEAKTAYQEALVLKPNDATAITKLAEVEKLINTPKPVKP